ncbi:MAG: glycosyltransferase [Ferruginibacter sp.]
MISEVMENRSNTISAEKDLNNIRRKMEGKSTIDGVVKLPEILFITSYPPRECGIATYSLDLIKAMNNKFNQSFTISICPIESEHEQHSYTEDVKYILNKDYPKAFITLAKFINADENIRMVMLQHEFGLFTDSEADLDHFLNILTKPVALVFHTVLPQPDQTLKEKVQHIAKACKSIIVMTNTSANILINDYAVVPEKVTVIPHGTHLVTHLDKELLKSDYKLSGKKVLSTFGLLSSGKSIETTLDALPAIVEKNPDVVFLIIGKTHPSVIKKDGERYRKMLEEKVEALKMQDYVQFINYFLPLPKLLEYLQLTDVYLFTSRDPNQAVSGTFAYAISCGCPIISTPIPHALEVLKNDAGIVVDFENSTQVSEAVIKLLGDDELRKNISSNGLHTMASTAWENAAIAHALLFEKLSKKLITLNYSIPDINLDHIKKMTTNFGMIQFSVINQPDIESGYTLDDNARAMIAMCQHFELTRNEDDIIYIRIYFKFIKHCLQSEGFFLNYVDEQETFTEQNDATNLADANGRAIWALGYLISIGDLLPAKLTVEAVALMKSALLIINKIHSTRAMAFVIKGLYYSNTKNKSENTVSLIQHLANRLVQMYRHEAENDWQWYESYLTYANSILPEALLCAWLATGEKIYKEIAKLSFDFLLTKTFTNNTIKVISNKTWLQKGQEPLQMPIGGEQPIDVAYTIMALSKFNEVFTEDKYQYKMQQSFNWFLGANHLNQIIYNPCTGGCYDGLEENYVNLNQGAESTVSYLMARLTMEKSLSNNKKNMQYVN